MFMGYTMLTYIWYYQKNKNGNELKKTDPHDTGRD